MINISAKDLLSATEPSVSAPARATDASGAAFSGLLDQFEARQADAPAKPARARAERAEREEEPAKKSARRDAPQTAKAKPAAEARESVATAPETLIAPASESAAAQRDQDAATQLRDGETAIVEDEAPIADTVAPIAAIAPAPTQQAVATAADIDVAAVSAIAAPQAAATAESDAAATPLAEAAAETAEAPRKPLATQAGGQSAAAAPSDEPAPAATPAQEKAAAQAADLGKRLDNAPMHLAVQVASEETAKPLKAPVSLANGMSHPAQTDAAAATQTAAAAPAVETTAAPEGKPAQTPTPQLAANANAPAAPAFAALLDAGNNAPLSAAGKIGGGEPSAIGGVATASVHNSAAQSVSTAAALPKPAPQPHPATEQVAVHIAKAAADGVDKISVKLKPAALGNVEVQIDLAADGRVHVAVSADRADTLDLLQRDVRGLERALADAGLQADQQSLSFSLRDHGARHDNSPGFAGRQDWRAAADGAEEPLPAGGYANSRAVVGGLDIRV